MSTKYLLPCPCGNSVAVGVAQAGLTLACACGRQLEVPTRGALTRLEAVGEMPATGRRAPRPVWGPRQGLLFVGCFVAAACLLLAAYLWLNPPEDEDIVPAYIETATPARAYSLFFDSFAAGIDVSQVPENQELAQKIKSHRVWMITWLVLAGVGLLTALASRLIPPSGPPGSERRVKRRSSPAASGG